MLENQSNNIMKKIYILTCVNENGDIVSVNGYKSKDEARKIMKAQYEAEKRYAEESGLDTDGKFFGDKAEICYGIMEAVYKWTVTEIYDPVAEDVESDKRKMETVERVCSWMKANFEDDYNTRKLDAPVNDYTAFYYSIEDETIFVWNDNLKNYTSIFNLPAEVAYEVANQIELGAYDYLV